MSRSTEPVTTPTDWGTFRPVRARPHEQRGEDDGGRPLVSLLLPRFRARLLQRWATRLNLQPFRLKLDAVGSFVWLHCDGDKTVAELGDAMVAEFGTKVEPVEQRLTKFLSQLSRGGIVQLEGREAVHESSTAAGRATPAERVATEPRSAPSEGVTA
jgi:Coenzyme PQQ synthesis protein D (PqqD)